MFMIILSALIYLGAFYYPTYLHLGLFIWMLPILITDKDNTYGGRAGWLWGFTFFVGHLSWLAYIVYAKGHGNARMLVYVLAISYFSMYAAFWLWLKQHLTYRLVRNCTTLKGKRVALGCTWIISTIIFMYLTCYCSLAIFGCFEGYPFINPLLPLVSWTWYMQPVYYIGVLGYWIIIVTINLLLAQLIQRFDTSTLIFCIGLFSFPLLFQYASVKKFDQAYGVIYLQPHWIDQELQSEKLFYAISRGLDETASCNTHVKLVLLPESSFSYNLLDWESKLSAWSSLFNDDTSILIGAHRYEGDTKYNCLYHIKDGKIIDYYDKNHLVPFVERVPWLWGSIPIFCDLFTCSENVFSYSFEARLNLTVAEFQPYICSELFFESKHPTRDKPILFICNDSWLGLEYARDLGKRCAQLYFLRYRVPIVYVGSYDWQILQ